MVIATNTSARLISVLGSTGSIGQNTVHLLQHVATPYKVHALTAYQNVELLAQQARDLQASIAVIGDVSCYSALKEALADTNIQVEAGHQAIIEAASYAHTDFVMSAIVGAAGLEPTLAAIEHSQAVIGLANKECLVCAGSLMMDAIARHNTTLIPVDSEHSAIFQALHTPHSRYIDHITLTASGGPFRDMPADDMQHVTPTQALAHPNWDMGAKISIDSATMMNKGLEIIEAYHLFPVEPDHIRVLIHPESIIHSMVTYTDGSSIAQLGTADMCTPIAVALAWPERTSINRPSLDLAQIASLHFNEPDLTRFPALRLAKEVLAHTNPHAASIIFNAANEIAVHAFLHNTIGFLDIVRIVSECLETESLYSNIASIADVIALDQHVRAYVSTNLHYTPTATAA